MDKEVLMPRMGANEDTVILGSWLVKEGEFVHKRQIIATLESTKVTQDLYSPADGYIHLLIAEYDEVAVGTKIAIITESADQAVVETPQEQTEERRFTDKARKLIEEHNIDVNLLPVGKLIREKDLEPYLGSKFSIKESLGNHLIIYGTGGWTREIINMCRQTHAYQVDYIIGGIGDWNDKESIMGVPIVKSSQLDELIEKGYNKVVNAVAVTPNAFSRNDVVELLTKRNFDFPNIIDRSAVFGADVKMGVGNLVMAGAVIGTEAIIGNHCVINANCTLSHNNIISDCCHIASGAVLAGNVVVGENTLIGQNCSIYANVHIGKNVLIQNGCSVFKDVPDNTIVKFNK